MRKRIVKMKRWMLVFGLCISVLGQTVGAYASETQDALPQAEETGVPDHTEMGVQPEFQLDLERSISDYFAENSEEEEAFLTALSLVIATQGDYKLTLEDLEAVKEIEPLKSLDVENAVFDSQETYEEYLKYFQGIEEFEYKYSENSYAEPEMETEPAAGPDSAKEPAGANLALPALESAPAAEAENVEAQAEYELALQGICLLDKGSRADVGVAYESTDPDVMFRWLQYDLQTGVWTEVSGWSRSNWVTWMPGGGTVGDYWIYVEAKTSDGKVETSVYGHHYRGVYVELSGMCLLNPGTRYDIGVAYTTNDPDIKFRWKLYDLAAQEWFLLQDAIPGNWISWTPTKAGDYWIHVEALDSLGGVTTYTMGYHFDGLSTTLTGICVLNQGSQVDMGVAYTTNDAGLEFRWLLYDLALEKWFEISSWSPGNWASWVPEKSGDYWLYVEARGSTGEVKSMVYGHHIDSAKITTLTSNPPSPAWVGSEIWLTGSVSDPANEVYADKYVLYNGQDWLEVPKNAGGALWKPEALGSYLLGYQIYGAGGNLIDESFIGYSIEVPWVNLSGIIVDNKGNYNVTMSVSSETNDRNILYKWSYYDLASQQWGMIRDWAPDAVASWQAPKGGTYWLHVEAKLSDGTVQSYTVGYVARRYQNPAGYYQVQDSISLTGADYNLSYGFEGLKVMYVMQALGLGDGVGMGGAFYGDNVILAVKAFQMNAGLPATGIVDYDTWITMGLPWQDWFNLGAYVSPLRVNADSTREEHIEAMISTAESYLGTPYVIGAAGAPGTGVDCSGLVMQALYAAGIDTSPINPVRHSYPGYEYESRNMWDSPQFLHVSYEERQRGDLIFYQNSAGVVIHVAIYLGNDMVIESWPNQVVIWPVMNSSRSNIKGVVRPFI